MPEKDGDGWNLRGQMLGSYVTCNPETLVNFPVHPQHVG